MIIDGYTAMQDCRAAMKETFYAEIMELDFVEQMCRGALRCCAPLNRFFPEKWCLIKTANGRVVNRFECAGCQEILTLFEAIEEEVENHLVPIEDVKNFIKDKPITAERLEAIFDRYS